MLPNFLIIGAAKAGTSSLYHYLRQHPDIFMPAMKEPKFFALEGERLDFQGPDQGINRFSVTSLEAYEALFEGVRGHRAVGEASPIYLYSPAAPERMRRRIPGARLIAVLRDPAERAFSSYCHLVRDGLEPLSFAEGLDAEEWRIRERWSPLYYYMDKGRYATQLARYYALFPREQLRIYLHEDLDADSLAVVRDACAFLGVDEGFTPEMPRLNISGEPRSRLIYDLFTKDNAVKSALRVFFPEAIRARLQRAVRTQAIRPKPVLDPTTRARLVEGFRDEILRLQEIIGRDLSAWLR